MIEHRDQVEAMKAPTTPSKNSAIATVRRVAVGTPPRYPALSSRRSRTCPQLSKEEKQYKVLKAMATACGFGCVAAPRPLLPPAYAALTAHLLPPAPRFSAG